MTKKNNSKWDIVWIIPEIIGSLGVVIAAALHIHSVPLPRIMGLMPWVFQMGLVIVVLNAGIEGVTHGLDQLKKIKRTQK